MEWKWKRGNYARELNIRRDLRQKVITSDGVYPEANNFWQCRGIWNVIGKYEYTKIGSLTITFESYIAKIYLKRRYTTIICYQ